MYTHMYLYAYVNIYACWTKTYMIIYTIWLDTIDKLDLVFAAPAHAYAQVHVYILGQYTPDCIHYPAS